MKISGEDDEVGTARRSRSRPNRRFIDVEKVEM